MAKRKNQTVATVLALVMTVLLVFGQVPTMALADLFAGEPSSQEQLVDTGDTDGESSADAQALPVEPSDSADSQDSSATPEDTTAEQEDAAPAEDVADQAATVEQPSAEATDQSDSEVVNPSDEATDDEQATVEDSQEAATVAAQPTATTSDDGVKVSLYDYWDTKNQIGPAWDNGKTNVNSAIRRDGFVFGGSGNGDWNNWTGANGDVYQGIVNSGLNSKGYPTLAVSRGRGTSLEYLFSDSDYAVAYENVTNLFHKSGNNYSYNAQTDYAYLVTSESGNWMKHTNKMHGSYEASSPKFLPFNEWNEGEDVSNPNYAFGMKVEATFRQPAKGITANNNQMIFSFTGDDDVWVYVDGVLVLDIGGIHDAATGTINFATGEVVVKGSGGQPHETTLREVMEEALEKGVVTQEWFDKNMEGNTFKDYSNHSLKFFYLERGHGGSNCALDFNLETIPEGNVDIYKKITDVNTADFSDATFTMQIDYAQTDDGSEPSANAYKLYDGYYQLYDGETKVGDLAKAEGGKIVLKNGQHARLLGFDTINGEGKADVPLKATDWYKVTELAGDGYDKDDYEFSVNDAQVETPEGTIGQSRPLQVGQNPSATVKNKFIQKEDAYTFTVGKQMAEGQSVAEGTEFVVNVASGTGEPYKGAYLLSKDGGDEFDTKNPLTTDNGKITLQAGWVAKILGVAPGTTFKVTEDDPGDLYLDPSYSSNDSKKDDGRVTVGKQTDDKAVMKDGSVTVTNSLNTGSLSITKKVAGNAANDQKHFSFKLEAEGLSGDYAASYTGVSEGDGADHPDTVTFTDGVATVQLKHGETVTIGNLPAGTSVTVTENVAGLHVDKTEVASGLEGAATTDVTANEGSSTTDAYTVTLTAGALTAATFTNTSDLAPQTGVNVNVTPMLGLLAAAGVGAAALIVTNRKKSSGDAWKE